MLTTSEKCVSVSSSVSLTFVSNSVAGVPIVCRSTLRCHNDLPYLTLPRGREEERYGNTMRAKAGGEVW